DLHLDRVERQLAEPEDRGGRSRDPRMGPDRMGSDRMGSDRLGMGAQMAPDRMPDRMGGGSMGRSAPPTERLPAPVRDDRPMSPPPSARPVTSMPAPTGPDPYGRYDEP